MAFHRDEDESFGSPTRDRDDDDGRQSQQDIQREYRDSNQTQADFDKAVNALVTGGHQSRPQARVSIAQIGVPPQNRGGVQQSPPPQVGDPLPTRQEILELFALGKARGGFDWDEASDALGRLNFGTLQINTMLGPRPVQTRTEPPIFPRREGTGATPSIPAGDIPGGPPTRFEREDRLTDPQALGGFRGIFDAITGPLASGLGGAGRRAVGRRFAPLEASFLTDFGAQGLGSEGGGITFEEFLSGNPQTLSQQGLLGRLQSIGQNFGDASGEEADFLATFTNNLSRRLFQTGATTGIASRFRDPRRARLDREFDEFLFNDPLGSIIGEIGRGGFR